VGLLADQPGAGKTFVVLAVLLADRERGTAGRNVVVVPQNIYTQWEDAIQRFSGALTHSKYIDYAEITSLYFQPTLPAHDILLTTPLYYNVLGGRHGRAGAARAAGGHR
jgi:SNF2 family DNA or RNA helicase